MSLKRFLSKITFQNFSAAVSLFCSVSALVIVAKISTERSSLIPITEKVHIAQSPPFSVPTEQQRSSFAVSAYDKIINETEFVTDKHHPADDSVLKQTEESIEVDNKITEQMQKKSSENKSFLLSTKTEDYSLDNNFLTVVVPLKKPPFLKTSVIATVTSTNEGIRTIYPTSKSTNTKKNSFNKTFSSLGGEEPRPTNLNQPIQAPTNKEIDRLGYFTKVEVGIFKTHSEAIAGWFRLKKSNSKILTNSTPYGIEETKGENGETLYRLYVESVNQQVAEKTCRRFKENGIQCKLV